MSEGIVAIYHLVLTSNALIYTESAQVAAEVKEIQHRCVDLLAQLKAVRDNAFSFL